MNRRNMLRKAVFVLMSLAIVSITMLAYFVEHFNITPRDLARYVEHQGSGHHSTIASVGHWAGQTLRVLDRMDFVVTPLPELRIGVQAYDLSASKLAMISPERRIIFVTSSDQARLAIANANPNDVITFSPGVYQFSGNSISVFRAGREDARILVRAEVPGTVKLRLSLVEGFHVSAPYWTFENLHLQGNCEIQSHCEHAFHVVGNGHHFVARNNTIVDFNSHIKVNMANQKIPDDGVIEYNSIGNNQARRTESPVTLIDLVAASRWRIEHNLITDFVKVGSDKISYGAFVKGGGQANHIVNNIVICEHYLRGTVGQRVGLSLGGGGTGKEFCPDQQCVTEQVRGVIESNLIMACSDDGIYLNKAADSRVTKNTLIDTGGIEVRFAESSADLEGNLVDGKIRSRDGGLIRERDNIDTNMSSLFVGYHPVMNIFNNPSMINFGWRQRPEFLLRSNIGSTDLCGTKNQESSVVGAFDDFNACLLKAKSK